MDTIDALRCLIRTVHGLPGVPAAPDPGAVPADGQQRRDSGPRTSLHGRPYHRGRADHRAVFAGFATGDLAAFQQFVFDTAVAVLLDATIVRTVLVPATMKLLGNANRYMP